MLARYRKIMTRTDVSLDGTSPVRTPPIDVRVNEHSGFDTPAGNAVSR
jgi:hypothetical protein